MAANNICVGTWVVWLTSSRHQAGIKVARARMGDQLLVTQVRETPCYCTCGLGDKHTPLTDHYQSCYVHLLTQHGSQQVRITWSNNGHSGINWIPCSWVEPST